VSNNGVNVDFILQPVNPVTGITTGTVVFNATGSDSGQFRSPFESTPHPGHQYTYVQAGGSATYNVGPNGADFLELIWGSPDPIPAAWNTITFYAGANGTGGVVDTANASLIPNIPAFPSGLENVVVQIIAAKFGSFKIGASQNAFEYSGLAWDCQGCAPEPTPIPGAALLMGSVLAGGIGGMQIMRRRRKAA
jgi:hypothetical protein